MINERRSDDFGAFYIWFDYKEKSFLERNLSKLDKLNIPKEDRIYVSKRSPTVIVFADKKKREEIAKTEDISPYFFTRPEKMADLTLVDIRADDINGTNAPPLSLSGNGIRVGVIAVENIIFDDNAKSLEGTKITVFPSVISPRTDSPHTCVVSEIVGKRIVVDDFKLMGVVRNASLYFDAVYSVKEVFEAIENMLDQGVRIINFSAGVFHDGIRGAFDRQIDRIISENDLLFVTAAGNFEKLASPAKAYNALAVGNLVTKSSPLTSLSPPFKVAESSAYLESASSPHKPDLVAPGEYIGFVNGEGVADFQSFGTSFATPFVTGVAAQLLEVRDSLSYLTLTALILMSANGDAVSSDDNPYVSERIRLKSGYGLLDALKAVDILKRGDVTEGVGDFLREGISCDELFFIFELNEEKEYPRLYIDGESILFSPERSVHLKRRVSSVRVDGNAKFSLILL